MKIVTLNLWGLAPDVTRRLDLAARQLAALAPDAIGLQEVQPLPGGGTTAHWLADRLGMATIYEPVSRLAPGGEEGLAVLSRAPIAEHRLLPLPVPRPGEERALLSARLEVVGGPVWLHNTHLHWRLDDGIAREQQVVAIDAAIRAIASPAPQILCGDFNATPQHDEIRFLRGEHTLAGRRTHYQDAYARIHPDRDGFTWCAQPAPARQQRSIDIDRRLDYIFVTIREKDGRGTILDADVTLTDRDDAGNCASDHYAVTATVRVAALERGA